MCVQFKECFPVQHVSVYIVPIKAHYGSDPIRGYFLKETSDEVPTVVRLPIFWFPSLTKKNHLINQIKKNSTLLGVCLTLREIL